MQQQGALSMFLWIAISVSFFFIDGDLCSYEQLKWWLCISKIRIFVCNRLELCLFLQPVK